MSVEWCGEVASFYNVVVVVVVVGVCATWWWHDFSLRVSVVFLPVVSWYILIDKGVGQLCWWTDNVHSLGEEVVLARGKWDGGDGFCLVVKSVCCYWRTAGCHF